MGRQPATTEDGLCILDAAERASCPLPGKGTVAAGGQTVRFIRPGVVEEYSVSIDGVRQDFIIEAPPIDFQPSFLTPRAGELRLELAVTGAQLEAAACGVRLVLEGSDRRIACGRLRVVDANGRELPARIELFGAGCGATNRKHLENCFGFVDEVDIGMSSPAVALTKRLAVLVNDADAVYPIRIDPTFSDEDWISMGGIPGDNNTVYAAAVDDWGILYIGGIFSVLGKVQARGVAKWDGTSWSPLGDGMDAGVLALEVVGGDLCAGGAFTNAGGILANGVAKWDGNKWSPLGTAMNGDGATLGSVAVTGHLWRDIAQAAGLGERTQVHGVGDGAE